ncbi:MAG: hypothetical protein COV74_05460 [Candidatus Omnitrophica bacterium CG11_big_fil_rev_8_21_14_0_20_45_26]|uniref:PilZ domain-containing protein n=1 Tax=Candidatus Abzuiibacterium crystallinum TaxID=1974748 RepID=A0A2H0LPF2_9BACT|nr:MAG: hypothetical protein COV74_05460 [Candidatus Omnitrophica bacterium CG11_big_fil_rev_8_21_14_0_20_45_26]PIW64338.1 MAG: hypothetical protein COW12_06780 [Candidatus Omnitrophica bacterium CG12_big_fil_rev_8_21_14_0_65_45_16]
MDKERRRFKRFDAFMSVKCGLPKATEKELALSLTKDISREGLCVNSNTSFSHGSVVNLEINLPDDPRPIRSSGKVVWSKISSQEEGIDYGIQFVNIDPIDKFRVLDFAYNHWLETKVNDFADPEDVTKLN